MKVFFRIHGVEHLVFVVTPTWIVYTGIRFLKMYALNMVARGRRLILHLDNHITNNRLHAIGSGNCRFQETGS